MDYQLSSKEKFFMFKSIESRLIEIVRDLKKLDAGNRAVFAPHFEAIAKKIRRRDACPRSYKPRMKPEDVAEGEEEESPPVEPISIEGGRSAATGSVWEPIQTAPRIDGIRVLGWSADMGDIFPVTWSPQRPAPHWTADSGAVVAPTIWTHLPTAENDQGMERRGAAPNPHDG